MGDAGRQRLWVDKEGLEGAQTVAVLNRDEGQAGKAREIIGCGTPRHGALKRILLGIRTQ